MSRCHFVPNPDGGKRILIPGCMGTAAAYSESNALDWCTCGPKPKAEKKSEIEKLTTQVERLCGLVEKMLKAEGPTKSEK